MRMKIRQRLFLYFTLLLVIFALLIGLVFTVLFSKHNMDIHKKELGARAERIAETLSTSFLQGFSESPGHGMGHGGYGAYLRFLDDIAMTDIWVVDPNFDQIMRGHGHADIAFKDLPENAEEIISKALAGKKSFSKSFSPLLGVPSITVATPIIAPGEDVAGAVLLHTQLEDISAASSAGLWLLAVSMFAAVLLSFLVAGILSSKFTKPLEIMKEAASGISGGDFTIKTGIFQQDEIGDLARAMDEMAGQLDLASQERDNLDQLRRDFLANISHELRTPVTVLRGSLEALNDGVVSEREAAAGYHRQMLAESVHLERLVSDLLDLSRLQNPDFRMEMQEVDIKEIVEDGVHSMRQAALQKNISININCDQPDLDYYGDYGRLRQMLMIVLENAVKFSPENSLIEVELLPEARQTRLIIADRGCGIPAPDLPHIFDRFYKRHTEENKSGTGLGLAIARQIAVRHNIDMKIESAVNRGTTVTFVFDRGKLCRPSVRP